MDPQILDNLDKRTTIYCAKSTISVIRKRLNDLFASINEVSGFMNAVHQFNEDGYICDDVADKYLRKEKERLDKLKKDVKESQIDIEYYTSLLNKVKGVEED